MNKERFESTLERLVEKLTAEAKANRFASAAVFENRTREILDEILAALEKEKENEGLIIPRVDFHTPAQGFPDIPLGEFGVEVKFTLSTILGEALRIAR
ncbi:MAG: hypothetical protein IKU86_06740 [Thermoguttaceae bacterium]|nr:hypothetical protein [Thermoguttaceae bacterium]